MASAECGDCTFAPRWYGMRAERRGPLVRSVQRCWTWPPGAEPPCPGSEVILRLVKCTTLAEGTSNELVAFSRDHGVAALIGRRGAICNLALGARRQPYDAVRGPGLRRRGVHRPGPISVSRQENVSPILVSRTIQLLNAALSFARRINQAPTT